MSSFWNTQPVNRGSSDGVIDDSKKVPKTQTSLPLNYQWTKVSDTFAIADFLEKYYVEDPCSAYRLVYTPLFFEYLFESPNHKEEYSLGLLHRNELIGYALAKEHLMSLRNKIYKIVSVNFLCLSKEYRNMNLAPLMIKEITRIANTNGIFQAVFTAERDKGFSISTAQYFHFPINEVTLIKAGIIDSPREVIMVPNCREDTRLIQDSDLIKDLYENINNSTILYEKFDDISFKQTFSGKNDIFYTVYNDKSKEFASFYIIYTKCLSKNILLKKAYLYYWYGSKEIVSDAISIASRLLAVDMFDLLNISNNESIIKDLKFVEGTGSLEYHMFNIKERRIDSKDLNFILF
jgi:glycylpeptide N-tetradecanoyltransferase